MIKYQVLVTNKINNKTSFKLKQFNFFRNRDNFKK